MVLLHQQFSSTSFIISVIEHGGNANVLSSTVFRRVHWIKWYNSRVELLYLERRKHCSLSKFSNSEDERATTCRCLDVLNLLKTHYTVVVLKVVAHAGQILFSAVFLNGLCREWFKCREELMNFIEPKLSIRVGNIQ